MSPPARGDLAAKVLEERAPDLVDDQEKTPVERAVESSYSHPGAPEADPVHDPDYEPMIDAIESKEHPAAGSLRYLDYEAQLMLDLPGFGSPEPDCGDPIPEAMSFCTSCGDVKQNPRNCLRYDCPDHAPFAIRRRVAGSSDGVGMGPKLQALANYLYAYRERDQRFQHFAVDIPDDYYVESMYQLEALKSILKTIMRELGIQGALVFHPYRHEGEDPGEENLGKWAPLLFHGHDWSDVSDDLEFDPHFHIVGVTPEKCPDLSDVGEFHEATGWIIHRIENEDNISIYNEVEMVRVLTYCLSHAGIYETEEQRRLAAWMVGRDINRVHVDQETAISIAADVHRESEDTLGIPSPSPECGNAVPPVVRYNKVDQEIEEFQRPSELRKDRAPWESDPIGGFAGPRVGSGGAGDRGDPWQASSVHVDAVGGMASTGSSIDGSSSSSTSSDGDGFDWSAGGPTSTTMIDAADGEKQSVPTDVVESELEECDGYCRHISGAGEYLLSGTWMEMAPYADDLDAAYRSYIDVMTSTGRNPQEKPDQLPEERVDAIELPPDLAPDD